jgi:hypothetical protein
MKRPHMITAICIVGYISVIFTFPQVFSPSVKKLGLFVPALYGMLVAAYFMACVGLWFFKQWGVQLYLLAFFARTLFYILAGDTGPGFFISLLLTSIFTFFLVRYYPKMDPNL